MMDRHPPHGALFSRLFDEPRWFILRTTRQAWAANWLDGHGIEAWFPTETRWRKVPGKHERKPFEAPIVSGYVFAAFPGQPLWHEIKHRSAGKVLGVVSVGVQPRVFTDAELLAMRAVPKRLKERKRQEEERRRIRPGDEVMHPTLGRRRVSGIDGPLAKLIAPLLGGDREVKVSVASLEKMT